MYSYYKSDLNKHLITVASKQYTKPMMIYILKTKTNPQKTPHQIYMHNKIQKMLKTSPKEYWKLLNKFKSACSNNKCSQQNFN